MRFVLWDGEGRGMELEPKPADQFLAELLREGEIRVKKKGIRHILARRGMMNVDCGYVVFPRSVLPRILPGDMYGTMVGGVESASYYGATDKYIIVGMDWGWVGFGYVPREGQWRDVARLQADYLAAACLDWE